MTTVQTPVQVCARQVEMVEATALLLRLAELANKHGDRGRPSHALGVRSAITMIKRDLARSVKARRKAEEV